MPGHFYLLFMQLVKFFVTVLYPMIRICLSRSDDMARINSNSPFLTSSPASISGSEPDRRLIVLVPDLEWDYLPAIHRIWELANAQRAHVLLLSLCKDPKHELSL